MTAAGPASGKWHTPCEKCPLRGLKHFRDFSARELEFVSQFKVGELSVERGATVLVEGTHSPHIYTVLNGLGFRYKLLSDGRHPQLASVAASFPVAGRTGTLRTRYKTASSRCARGKVKAKTGFVNGVVALSGTARAADGKPRVFSIVANNIPSRRYSVRSTQYAVDSLAATITGCY